MSKSTVESWIKFVMNSYRKQALTLAHELDQWVAPSIVMPGGPSLAVAPEKKDVKSTFLLALGQLALMEPSSNAERLHLREDLGLDSLDLVELVMNCETSLGIVLADAEWLGLSTISEWIQLLEKKVTAR
jgi:acyl carrier protein